MAEKSILGAAEPSVGRLLPILSEEDWARIRAERAARVAEWANLPLRQDFLDERWMRAHLRAAGVRIGSDLEPATPDRLRSKLRSVGIHAARIKAAIGGTLDQYLARNPNLPLWAATALVLEADGALTPGLAEEFA